ncbi:hypothetical protein [Luteococcus sp.]|uniref:hypothetical protein n=1 Tax=Luteococcus sp. TaxID=1969402 RepID=UPI003735405A
MKPMEEWGADEWVTTGLAVLLGGSVVTKLSTWWSANGRQWLLDNEVLVPSGPWTIPVGSYGSLDAPRILGIAAALVLMAMVYRLMVEPSLRKKRAQKDAQDKVKNALQELK